ncbi:YigZ family protein [Cohaesibacter sp. CAU 1516]|uniref:IMPACT family protein n=1 Tax=Cohaesibacter sp. CAU 1516 TaxID=2576038 RepID=UPI0010FF6098|nr:YigZ family protein [Cohaesibacter sp. CAU 1516]TLP45946.1 YigZ family protein [Cohaesibacter sp. CAU 1516]
MAELKTIEAEFYAELEEKKSRFLAFLVPIDQFEVRLEALRIEHRKASHHVTAFRRIHDDDHIEEGAKDDGEPAGTSGMPMLKVLIGRELIDCGVIVVRYFGGTKLGAGGLARAYSGAASRAIDAAQLVVWQRLMQYTVKGRFDQTADLERQIGLLRLDVQDRHYTETGVDILVEGPEAQIEAMKDFLHELNLY